MKKEIGIIAIAVFLLIQTAVATPIENPSIIEDFPDTMIAGSTYEVEYQFDNTQPINLTIFFNITNPEATVNLSEFTTKIKLNNNPLNCSETLGGIFKCEEWTVSQTGTNNVSVNLSSRIDLQPSENYTFELGLWIVYEFEEEITEEKKYVRGGGGGGGGAITYPTLTPTLTSTPEVTPTPVLEVTPTPTPEVTPTPTPTVPDEEKGIPYWIWVLIAAGFVGAGAAYWLHGKKGKGKK